MKLQIPEGWYKLNPEERVYRGDRYWDNNKWNESLNFEHGGQSVPYTYIREIGSNHSAYVCGCPISKLAVKETMKSIDVTLTADEAVIIWRLFNEFGTSSQNEEFKKSQAYKEGIIGTNGTSNLEKEWEAVNNGNHTLWRKINVALDNADISGRKYKAEPAILVGGNEVKFENGQIKVGCTTISNDIVKQIAAKLK